MARKPNYRWERHQRDKDKATKREAKRAAKAARRAAKKGGEDPDLEGIQPGDGAPPSEDEPEG